MKISKSIPFYIFLFFSLNVFAQYSKINFHLKHAITNAKHGETISLLVRGDVLAIKQIVNELGGQTGLSAKDVVQITLPIATVEEFSKNESVKYIEYSLSKGSVLNDTMIVHNNIVPVHNGNFPLTQSYTGKGVLLGFIDTGTDVFHQDFKDSLGNTRILSIWDQSLADNGSSTYGYGQVWDSAAINAGSCTHIDQSTVGHGTHVSGVAAGNGSAVNNYKGVAPEASIVVVASNSNAVDWLSTVVDAINYIYNIADSYNMPCVINISMGDYWGSHDGKDAASLLIDSIVNSKSGRVLVCAAGNAGALKWHVEHNITSDTTFTWFKYNPSSAFGYGAVYFEAWADTTDLNQVEYAFGANLPNGNYEQRGVTPFANIKDRLGLHSDTIFNDTNILAIVETYAEIQGDRYTLQMMMNEPDSNSYYFSFLTTGSGRLDIWSATWLGVSEMVESPLPDNITFPQINFYEKPDSLKTMVSSFQNIPSVITVGNFNNRATYLDVDSIVRSTGRIPGSKAPSSSFGPTRTGVMKPDIAATGDESIGPVSDDIITANMNSTPANRAKIAYGAHHRKNGGTSMASPVVAGIAALYLQKCPTATMSEVKNAIISTAIQDTFTGIVPNYGFGYGKIDAFATLNSSNYSVSLGSDFHICDGDSVNFSTQNSYSGYLWSTNDTSSSITIDSSSSIFVTVMNSSGCKAMSDTIYSFWHSLPLKPILSLMGNDTLLYSTSQSIQWYYQNSPLPNENDTLLIAQNNGDYFLTVTDSFNCKNYSDTITLISVSNPSIEHMAQFDIFPNPTNDKIIVKTQTKQSSLKVNLLDSYGKIVLKTSVNQEISLSNLSSGIYYIMIEMENKTWVEKVIYNK